MEYRFSEIEERVKNFWKEKNIYRVGNAESGKPKFYVLDMFPYPSGAGLHVGHPLGYIASDIYARFKRMKGFNVLHPMGMDSFGLPAEQYAIQTGQHPVITTEQNIATFKRQMDQLGFSFDWTREVRTSDPKFYKWTQWIFIQLFQSWYNNSTNKAEKIDSLISEFEKNGNKNISAATDQSEIFSADGWKSFSAKQKSDVLLNYRLAYIADSWVNWCPALGTVLANDEVKDGVSERGGYLVERKLMKQWSLRITAYADRLLQGLNDLEWSDSIKEAQRNWIGKSEGASVKFKIAEAHSTLLRRGAGGEEEKNSDEEKSPGYLSGDTTIASHLLKFAKENRRNPTEAEEFLWEEIRNRKLVDKFRRQHLIEKFVVDFVCLEKRLIVELDGAHHKSNKEYDEARTKILSELGYKVLRFWNEDVLKKTKKILDIISAELRLRDSVLTLNPSPKERETDADDLISINISIEVFTTRPDTIFGVTFLTLAPEHELISHITTDAQRKAVEEYVTYAKNRSERERMTDVKKITGVFTGAYAVHPFSGKQIPVWIGEYVLASYGTGAVMGVPGHDSRDYGFAKHFNLEIIEVVSGGDISKEAFEEEGVNVNSSFLDGLKTADAKKKSIDEIEKLGIGKRKINFKQRDAIFGRQRYWGEPIPIYYNEEGIPNTVDEKDLPVLLPEVDKYLPTENGEPPLARASNWKYKGKYNFEQTTMPGWAGSSWYFLRYEDPNNEKDFVSKDAINYWQNIDFYIGGAEHSTGHLLYFRFWTKFLFDLGLIPFDEPAKRLVNQGMIQGVSQKICKWGAAFVKGPDEDLGEKMAITNGIYYKHGDTLLLCQMKNQSHIFYSADMIALFPNIFKINATPGEVLFAKANNIIPPEKILTPSNIPVEFINDESGLEFKKFIDWYKVFNKLNANIDGHDKKFLLDYENTVFACEGGYWKYQNGEFAFEKLAGGSSVFKNFSIVEKMSKSKYNVVNPEDMVSKYGADCFRMYEMFLGPIEMSKPWDTKGIDGVSRFLRKLWKLFYDDNGNWSVTSEAATTEELKILHKAIKKTEDDMEKLSFNTSVSSFMICVNTLTELKCHKAEVLKDLLLILSPFAPFTTEFLWREMKQEGSIVAAAFPKVREDLLVENSFEYPVAVNGKTKTKITFPLDKEILEIEKEILATDAIQKILDGKQPKKVIVIKGRMINVVV